MDERGADAGILVYETPQSILQHGDGAAGSPQKSPHKAGSQTKLSPIKVSPSKHQSLADRRQLLDSVIVPRTIELDGKPCVQRASLTPATRVDVVAVQKRLDAKLKQLEARETGLCPIRSDLYAQAFDELIRQVTLMNSERGLLLLRVRNELRMTVAAYQTAYESALAYGMRAALKAEARKRELRAARAQTESEVADLRAELARMEAECARAQKDAEAARAEDLAKHQEEANELLKVQNAQMETLEEHLAVKKK